MESIWHKDTALPRRSALKGVAETQVAIIGGGLAGILIAAVVKARGMDCLVLERGRLGSGQTGNTTAKVTAQHGMIYDKLLRTFGPARAREYARANQWAVEEYRRVIREKRVDCGWTDAPAYVYTTGNPAPLEAEARAAAALGLRAEFTRETELPLPVTGAVRLAGQGHFQPLRFLEAMSREITVYENTPALEVKGGRIRTPEGQVRARQVVFACHYPFINVPGWYFLRQHQERSYVLALRGAQDMEGMYLGADPDGLSFRPEGKLLFLGGGNHRTGENPAGGKYEQLWAAAQKFWPGCREEARWSAQDCMTLDGVPYIGRFSRGRPEWYVATGFGKWGMTTAMVAGRILSAQLAGEKDPDEAVFSPRRFLFRASLPNLLENGKQSVKGLSKGAFARPRKIEEGEAVSGRCTHLGCKLTWNPDEKSWDCPCHGSRFDCHGTWLSGPAQRNLKKH